MDLHYSFSVTLRRSKRAQSRTPSSETTLFARSLACSSHSPRAASATKRTGELKTARSLSRERDDPLTRKSPLVGVEVRIHRAVESLTSGFATYIDYPYAYTRQTKVKMYFIRDNREREREGGGERKRERERERRRNHTGTMLTN